MGIFTLMDRHADLVGRMTKTLDIDLVEAAQRGQVPEEALRSVVVACAGCKQVDECGDWLADHADGADAAPAYCRNKALFDRLG